MAARDIKFYNYLIEAFRYKVKYPNATSFQSGNYFFDYSYIFQQARKVFPQNYNLSQLDGKNIKQLTPEELDKLNNEYAKEIVNRVDGINGEEKDEKLLDYLKVETAPEESDKTHQEIEAHNKIAEQPSAPKEEGAVEGNKPLSQGPKPPPPPPLPVMPKNPSPAPVPIAPKTTSEAIPTAPSIPNPVSTGSFQGRFKNPVKNPKKPSISMSQAGQIAGRAAQSARTALGPTAANLGSSAAIFTNRAANSLGGGLMNLIKDTASQVTGGRSGGGGSSSGGNGGGSGGSSSPPSRSFFPSRGGGDQRGSNGGRRRLVPPAGGGGNGGLGGGMNFGGGIGKKWLWGILLGLILVVILQSFMGSLDQGGGKNLELKKTGPAAVENGANIVYQITANNTASGPADITVTDPLQANTKYVDSVPPGELTGADAEGRGGIVTWKLTGIPPKTSVTLALTLEPQEEDIWVVNKSQGTSSVKNLPSGGVTVPGENLPPNQDTCGGKYKFLNPLGNFGDPACVFDPDKLHDLLVRLDPDNAEYWYLTVARQESSFNPNSFNGSSTSGAGAYGLFQMNPAGKGATDYDRGDVNWDLQTSNAVNYNKYLTEKGIAWCYWEAAKDRWRNCPR